MAARLWSGEPRLAGPWVLYEPTAHLDPAGARGPLTERAATRMPERNGVLAITHEREGLELFDERDRDRDGWRGGR